jgi:pimeloyl-ACP methyl ester carboxylesterase
MNTPVSPVPSVVPADPRATTLPPGAIGAVVHTPLTETRYLRAGHGSPVILLGAQDLIASPDIDLFAALAQRFRVIVPTFPHPMGDPSDDLSGTAISASIWLRHLIDGLGLECPSLVADDAFGVVALGFALTDPDRVGRLVVLSRDGRDPALPANVFGDTLARTGHRLLLLRLGPAGASDGVGRALAHEVTRFLDV